MRRYTAIQALFLLQLFFFSSYVFSASEVITAPMEQTEQEALYLVIQAFVGEWWNGSGLYPDPCGWTPIQGVLCDLFEGLWYITVLNIGPVFDNSLACSQDARFTAYLFELRHLRSLSFFNCFSSSIRQPATIPSQNWQKLAGNLETLEFRSNQGLTGAIPAGLSLLINLQSLVLVENSLTGELPQELGNLVHLRRLSLACNQLSGPIPASLGDNLVDLLILDLSTNSLAGPLPPSLGNMNSLLKLDLSYNNLNGKLPGEVEKLKNLTILDLRNNNLSGGLSQSFQGITSLQDLLLSNNPVGGNLMEFRWENMRNLTTLNLSNMNLTGEIPESITEIGKLRYLDLSSNNLSGSVSPKFAALPCLNALYLNGNNLTGELGFSAEFYQRMGRRFASFDNPSLCYRMKPRGHVPVGVAQCKHQHDVPISNLDSGNKLSDKNPNQKSSFMASFGLSNSSIAGFWWVLLMQAAAAAAFLLLMLA
ncbi:piriformospora indica-insensitive protein 2-like isoform X1 [Elaeis guineensis]|uniref:Piriformospora indica-insensitive protein 2-like n=1 Tax=Elaeis guineensis var. tenera TaxID=51953 RepID=A0A6I9RER5_ELAGV|nr:piriformospora indica-insensitive protein 2-like [Elaeis guineensis]